MDSLLLMFRVFEVVSNIKCRRFSSMVEGCTFRTDTEEMELASSYLMDKLIRAAHPSTITAQASRVKPKVVRWPLIETDRWMGYNTAVVGL